MEKIIKENYESIVLRGLINSRTTDLNFLMKLKEEVLEVESAYYSSDIENMWEEVADVILVCLNFAHHFNIDIEKELKNKIKKNYTRK
jgi:NTP pyrophosphatase (non-canonical NTP hydrolase)